MTVEVPQIQFLVGGMVGIFGLGAWLNSGYIGLRQFLGASEWFLFSMHLEIGRSVMSPLYLALPVRCLVLAQCFVRLWIHVQLLQGGLWKNLFEFLHEGVDSGS